LEDSDRKIDPEVFWMQLGAATMLVLLAIYVLPVVIAVVWFVVDTPRVPREVTTLTVSDAVTFKVMTNVMIMVVALAIWTVLIFYTMDPCRILVRKCLVKAYIRRRVRGERRQQEEAQDILELKQWIKEQGFKFKGEQDEATT